ncbi:MAG: SH3 domain-containing protein [Gammaproteobacteria bacterium]|nr:SH3 domain-containing protein [Gammaproteobacteria bacterium]MBU1601051.1 SH3 domain-containing protein [Gammaproteobacteria bacterium]MBU2434410.1 SH3 domain-containing protein [Gammaproteobacteria bacterium]MBU2450814.1 SH3 domain-containing protein [Gammaproteobacteria bacterium]
MIAIWRRALVALSLISAAGAALAIDYRSVGAPAAILFDAPSLQAKKLYLIKAQTPVEVVVKLEGWLKVRDAEGTLAWIESRHVAEQRTLVVTSPQAEIRQSDNPDSAILAELDKWVAVEYLEPASPGWVKVRHRDGVTGYIHSTQVWGL